MEKTVVTTGCKNFRDLGGLPCNDASFTKFHKIYRSDCLSRLTDADIEILKDKGISCIIDLRTKLELSIRPNPLANLPGFSYYNISLFDGVKSKDYIGNQAETLPIMYKDILDESGEYIGQVFKTMVKHKDERIIFHCVAGKDRTGIITALLLKLSGVPNGDIISNYAISSSLMSYLYDELLLKTHKDGQPFSEHLFWTKPEYMREFLTYLETKYNGAKEYLLKYLDQTELDILANLLRRSD